MYPLSVRQYVVKWCLLEKEKKNKCSFDSDLWFLKILCDVCPHKGHQMSYLGYKFELHFFIYWFLDSFFNFFYLNAS